MTGNYW